MTVLLILGLAALVNSCASLNGSLLMRSTEIEDSYKAAEELGIAFSPTYYHEANQRWPWANGSQLQRRALILAHDPNPKQLSQLDKDQNPNTEFKILGEIFRHPH